MSNVKNVKKEKAIILKAGMVKAGRIIPVYNKFSHAKAEKVYYSIWVEDYDGSNERCLLFTEWDLQRAEKRAFQNPEDLTEKGWFTDLLD
jgi:hypothetical protein